MATSQNYVEFVCEQINGIGNVRYRKMFGEYMVYLNDKPIFLVCDNNVYIKKLSEIEDIIDITSVGIPYKGAKEHYVLDIENSELSKQVALILEKIIPIPKPKKKKQ